MAAIQDSISTSPEQQSPQVVFGQRIEAISDESLINHLKSEVLESQFPKGHAIWKPLNAALKAIQSRSYDEAEKMLAGSLMQARRELNLHRFDDSTLNQWQKPIELISQAQIVLSFKSLRAAYLISGDPALDLAKDIVRRYGRPDGGTPDIYDPKDIVELRDMIFEEYRNTGRELTPSVREQIGNALCLIDVVRRQPILKEVLPQIQGSITLSDFTFRHYNNLQNK